MPSSRMIIAGLAALLFALAAPAREPMSAEEFLASLEFHSGEVELPGGIATVGVPDDFRYLSPADAERVLVNAWGNPPGNQTLGMLVPGADRILSDDGWAIIISYDADGYVRDDDADRIDFDALLDAMRAAAREANEDRLDAGYDTVELVGWAAKPRYDKKTHKLYWAKELKFGDMPVSTVNYNVRVLGRRGVLVLNLVAGMPQLAEIEQAIPRVIAMTRFNPGYRYRDFNPELDAVAAYGLGALVAGKLASEADLAAMLGAWVQGPGKVWLLVLVALFAVVLCALQRRRATRLPHA
ncbi:MAG: DUF2167 domain-containing protein [Gammaproteobacteria bacterium]|nr:DUF2167 domain-containing protein [Gammaproteobacteria bacterium]